MNTKKNDAPKQEQKGNATSKNETTLKTLPNTKIPTVEELQKKVKELEGKLSVIPNNLEERIEYFSYKKELIRKLSNLNANKNSLLEHLDALSEIAANDEFNNDEYFLNIESGGKYSKNAIFSLKNPVIIGEVISFIIGRVDNKINDLEKQIEA